MIYRDYRPLTQAGMLQFQMGLIQTALRRTSSPNRIHLGSLLRIRSVCIHFI